LDTRELLPRLVHRAAGQRGGRDDQVGEVVGQIVRTPHDDGHPGAVDARSVQFAARRFRFGRIGGERHHAQFRAAGQRVGQGPVAAIEVEAVSLVDAGLADDFFRCLRRDAVGRIGRLAGAWTDDRRPRVVGVPAETIDRTAVGAGE